MDPTLYPFAVAVSLLIIFYLVGLVNSHAYKLALPSGARDGCIDGSRGFLALFVFFHHFAIFQHWKSGGEWLAPNNHLMNNLGVVSVQIFFMITAYLFIKKIKKGNVSWPKLYKSRFFRVAPLYLFAVFITIFYSTLLATRSATPEEYLLSLTRWLLYYGDGFPGYHDANNITAGVTWTLKYEWLFYLSLPLFAFFINKKLTILLFLGMLVLYGINFSHAAIAAVYLMPFAMGWFMVVLEEKGFTWMKVKFDTPVMSALMLIIFALALSLNAETRIGMLSIQLCGFMLFLLISQGCSVFGLLRSRPAVILGEVSYSIYLTHGITLFTLSTFFNVPLSLYTLPLFAFVVVMLSMATYKYIEKPFIDFGRRKAPSIILPKTETPG